MSSIVKADPGYYSFYLKERDNGQVVLSKHPIIGFRIDSHGEMMRPVTAAMFAGSNNCFTHGFPIFTMTPDQIFYEHGSTPCDMATFFEILKNRYGDKLEFHVSVA